MTTTATPPNPNLGRDTNPSVVKKAFPAETNEAKDGILRTADGLRRKVLVKDLDLVCMSDPTGGERVGEPLDYVSIWYVYAESPPGGPPMFQIGPREGPPRGWVPAASVLEWETRLVAQPTPRGDRPPLVMYREESCLLDALAGRTCPKHKGRCPIEGEEPGSGPNGSATTLGLPILKSEAIPEPDGSSRTVFQVASLVRDQAPPPRVSDIPADLRSALRRIDVAFAIDTTASMQDSINAARTLAKTLVADASRRHKDVVLRLALVEYRDHSPVFGYPNRIVTELTDPKSFLAALNTIEAARTGDGSVDEAVLDGVSVALPAPKGDEATPHLAWPTGRAGELATKMLVLIGNAPDHARDLKRARDLSAQARQSGITIAAVSIVDPNLSENERERFREQWHALAEGSFRPRDKSEHFQKSIPPVELTLAEASQLAPRLQAIIDDRIEHARNLAALAQAEAERRLEQYVTSKGLTLDQVMPVLVDLHKGETESRPDPQFQGRKAPSVRRGWIAERREGKPMVTVGVLMSRTELDLLIDELTQLQIAAQGTAHDLKDLLQIGVAAASGETSFLAADRGRQTFDDYLRKRAGLPPGRPDSLLRRDQSDLLQADDLTRAALNARLSESIERLTQRRNQPDWDDPRRTVAGMAVVPYEDIDF